MGEWRIERLDREHVREGFDFGIHAVVVDALDAGAKAFYKRFGFMPLTDDEMPLFLPLGTIRSAAKP